MKREVNATNDLGAPKCPLDCLVHKHGDCTTPPIESCPDYLSRPDLTPEERFDKTFGGDYLKPELIKTFLKEELARAKQLAYREGCNSAHKVAYEEGAAEARERIFNSTIGDRVVVLRDGQQLVWEVKHNSK